MASVLAAMMIWCRSGLNMSVLVGLSRRARVARGVVPHRISGCGSVLLSGFSLAEQKRESKRGISELLEAFAPEISVRQEPAFQLAVFTHPPAMTALRPPAEWLLRHCGQTCFVYSWSSSKQICSPCVLFRGAWADGTIKLLRKRYRKDVGAECCGAVKREGLSECHARCCARDIPVVPFGVLRRCRTNATLPTCIWFGRLGGKIGANKQGPVPRRAIRSREGASCSF